MTTLVTSQIPAGSLDEPSNDREFVTLRGVPWSLYCQLRDLDDNDRKRMIYDSGMLVIMSPAQRHERLSAVLNLLILVWTDEKQIDIENGQSMTFRREDLEKGLEPNQCYYIQNAPALRATEQIDLSVDPPPDLVLEVDFTSPSDSKIPIYAAMGVPEVWVWKKSGLQPLILRDGRYKEASASVQLPGFPLVDVVRILSEHWAAGQTAMRREFRAFILAMDV